MSATTNAPSRTNFLPWTVASSSMEDFIHADATAGSLSPLWRDGQLSELGIVNVTAALIAGVVSSAFTWPVMAEAPWTVTAVFYATLFMALRAVAAGSQQSIALNRYGQHSKGLELLQKHLKSSRTGNASRMQLYVWQMPVMLLNISIALFLIGVVILVWARAAKSPSWDADTKIAFVATLAGIFALMNYLLGASRLYRS